jgi:DNA-directed RNA polymerase specialized sigma subunit
MTIAWKYINKNSAVIAAIRDYHNMRFIINNTPDEIKEVYEKMTAPRSAKLTGLPSPRNPQAESDKLAKQIDKLDLLRERYSSAVEYMAWFEPAWSSMTDTEQCVLREFYMSDNQKSGATYRLMNELNYSESHVERMRSNALNRLRVLLYG